MSMVKEPIDTDFVLPNTKAVLPVAERNASLAILAFVHVKDFPERRTREEFTVNIYVVPLHQNSIENRLGILECRNKNGMGGCENGTHAEKESTGARQGVHIPGICRDRTRRTRTAFQLRSSQLDQHRRLLRNP